MTNIPSHNSGINPEWVAFVRLFTDRDWLSNGRYKPVDVARLGYRSHVMSELIRLKWDSKFKAFKAPRVHRELFKLEGMLWYRVLNLVQEVFLLDKSGYIHSATWFSCICLELRLVGPFAPDVGKKQFIKQLRSENKQLSALNNPFDSSTSPHTWRLIERAMDFAASRPNFDVFRKETYTPMVKARMALTTCVASSEFLILTSTEQGVIVQRQGRKPQRLSTSRSN